MPIDYDDVALLLRRAGFGASDAEISSWCGSTLTSLVDTLLQASGAPADTTSPGLTDPSVQGWDRVISATHYWLNRMATTPAPLVEKMALFWHGHFTSGADKVSIEAMVQQIAFYRANALGNVRTLARGMAVQPAMLTYLDNASSTKDGPNHNFAREMYELFLLGVGNYMEDDVVATARAWTGHTVDPATGQYVFRADLHDAGLKQIFGVVRAWDGPDTIDRVFDDPALRPTTARFLAGKLWSFFAGPAPAPDAVTAVAESLLASNWDVTTALRTLFLRPELLAGPSRTGLVRSPIEYAVAVMRITGLSAQVIRPDWYLGRMGQMPYFPPDVSGWKQNGYWLTTAATTAKGMFLDNLAWQMYLNGRTLVPASRSLTPDAVADAVAKAIGRASLFPPTRAAIVGWLNANRAAYFDEWAEYRYLVHLTFLSPDFQLA